MVGRHLRNADTKDRNFISYAIPPHHSLEEGSQFTRLVSNVMKRVNDPSAGSPTETLLRLLLPLDDQVCSPSNSKRKANLPNATVRRPH